MTGSVWVRLPLSEEDRALLAREFPGLTFHAGFDLDSAEQARTEVLFTSDPFSDDFIQAMPWLKWVQVTRGGGASYITPSMRERSIRVTTCTGIHGAPFSEFTFATILTLTKQLPQIVEAQRAHRWVADMGLGKLEGSTLGVVGLGRHRIGGCAEGQGIRDAGDGNTPAPGPQAGLRGLDSRAGRNARSPGGVRLRRRCQTAGR